VRLVQYRSGGCVCSGIVVDGEDVFATDALAAAAGIPGTGWTTRRLLEAGDDTISRLGAAARERAVQPVGTLGDLELGPPLHDPDKILCLGLNYRDHAEEAGLALPAAPMIFAKFRNCLSGPADTVALPRVSQKIDYEAELAVVIGRRCKDVSAEHALDHVAGAMAFNDVTARDVQHATSQWTAGKALDTFAPCGPALVLRDELPDLQDLKIEARVNGRTVQSASTRLMIFPIAETLAFISSLMTLEPGDIIATGTPAGVGVSHDPQILLRDGDVVEIEIERIGRIVNRFVVPQQEAA
jgi:2-keto-4-pentenoate hydratase/2-oxohepta-3-ene-1,7-dioic acid hydratase in catechol pathway